MFFELARHQVTLGDLQLLRRGVARQADDFEAITQRGLDGIEPVRRGDEQHLREVKRQVEVVIGEGVVLLGIQHFEQRGGRITPEVRANLVDLVQQDDRIARLDAAQRLDDATRHGSHVGPPMATDLRFIAQATQRDAGKLTAQSVRHALAERRLADPGRADEAQQRSFDILLQLDDRDEVEQPLLDLLQSEMLLVQDSLRRRQIDGVFAGLVPRQSENPIEIGSRDGVFRDHRRHLRKPLDFLERNLADFLGQRRLLDLLTEIVRLRRHRVSFAQLTLDGADLFAQEKVALALRHRAGDVVLNLGTQRGDFELAIQQRLEAIETLFDIHRLDQLLALVEAQVEIPSDQVGEIAAGIGVDGRDLDLVGQSRVELDDLLKLPVRVPGQRGRLDGIRTDLLQHLDLRAKIRLLRFVFDNPHPPQALDQHPDGVVRELQHLQHTRAAAVLMQVIRERQGDIRLLLEHEREQAISLHDVIDQPDALGGIDEQRRDHARENDDVRKA